MRDRKYLRTRLISNSIGFIGIAYGNLAFHLKVSEASVNWTPGLGRLVLFIMAFTLGASFMGLADAFIKYYHANKKN